MGMHSETQVKGSPEYRYNNTDTDLDDWGENFSSRIGDGKGDHEEVYLDMLSLLIELNRNGAMLDIGCGLGRVTSMAKGRISEAVALEPDRERFEDVYRNFHDPPKMQILNQMSSSYIEENPGRQFDLVVLGMVIQHVSTNTCRDLIKDVSCLLKPDGTAIISTTLVPECARGFSYSEDSKRAYIPREEFDQYAENPLLQDKGIPVRRFAEAELKSLVAADFHVLQWTQFSYYRASKIRPFCRSLKVSMRKLKDVGNSQFVVLRKRV